MMMESASIATNPSREIVMSDMATRHKYKCGTIAADEIERLTADIEALIRDRSNLPVAKAELSEYERLQARVEKLEGAIERVRVWYHDWDDASLEIEQALATKPGDSDG